MSSSLRPRSPSFIEEEEETTTTQPLIPGLSNDVAALILASIPFSHHALLKPTSLSWHAFLSSRSLLPLRRHLRLPLRHLLCLFPSDPSISPPLLFDPSGPSWLPLPTLPCSLHLYGLSNFVPISLGYHLYLLGGSHFDARSYPIGHPLPSSAVYCLDLSAPPPLSWRRLPDMLSPRGSFACAPSVDGCSLIVAGGGSRHTMYPSVGTRISSVETYDIVSEEWKPGEQLPRYRAGCVGFLVRRRENQEEDEFWVMGGYGDYRTVSGVVPADVYYRDAVVFGLRSGKWREVGDMWETGERRKLGSVVVVYGDDENTSNIYMLEQNDIFRYDFGLNRWLKESSLPRKIPGDESCVFAAMDGELYIMTSATPPDALAARRSPKKKPTLGIQVYEPKLQTWRNVMTSPPLHQALDFKAVVSCTIQL